jgi:hypothetical protein
MSLNKNELIGLLESLYEYMDQRADADADSDGQYPNEEMRFLVEIGDTLHMLGVDGYGSPGRESADPRYIKGGFKMESIEKIKSEFKRYL